MLQISTEMKGQIQTYSEHNFENVTRFHEISKSGLDYYSHL